MISMATASLMLGELQKAVTAGTISDIVPEDLEPEAHNLLWSMDSPTEMILLKLCPTVKATSIEHQFDQITSMGGVRRGFGFFSETTLPRETTPAFRRVVTNIKILGETSSTFILASLQQTIKVDGQVGADAIARNLLMKNTLQKKNFAMYFSDSSKTRLGNSGQRFRGLLQCIREGTDGTVGTASPYGSHVIDMEGLPFTVDNVRQKFAQAITLFGQINQLIMDPFTRGDFEGSMDGAQRIVLPIDAKPFMLGQNIGGVQTQGGNVFFHTDNQLSPLYAQLKYVNEMDPEAPTSAPAVVMTLNSSPTGSNVSKWLADDGGEFFWMITEIKNDRESLGRRVPASGTQPVAAGQEVQFDITPTDPTSDTFKIYRGTAGQANTDAFGAFEVANDGSGSTTAYDLNAYRPNTTTAFALNIRSDASDFLNEAAGGQRSRYALAVESSEKFLGMKDRPENTVSLATLGPALGVMQLATILMTTSRPALYSACAMQLRNPYQNFAFINIKPTTLPT